MSQIRDDLNRGCFGLIVALLFPIMYVIVGVVGFILLALLADLFGWL